MAATSDISTIQPSAGKITEKELEHLAVLARIKLTEDDKKSLMKEFDSILGYIDQLKKVDVSMEISGRVGAVKNATRPDIAVALPRGYPGVRRPVSVSDRVAREKACGGPCTASGAEGYAAGR